MKLIPNDGKYITTIDFNIFLGAIFDERLIQTKLGTKVILILLRNTVFRRITIA